MIAAARTRFRTRVLASGRCDRMGSCDRPKTLNIGRNTICINITRDTIHTRPNPQTEEIARSAYSFFEAEGRLDGHNLGTLGARQEQLSKARSPGNKSQTSAKPKSTLTNNHEEEKVFSADPPRGREEERYAQGLLADELVVRWPTLRAFQMDRT